MPKLVVGTAGRPPRRTRQLKLRSVNFRGMGLQGGGASSTLAKPLNEDMNNQYDVDTYTTQIDNLKI